jgi:putative proteasome-type protease
MTYCLAAQVKTGLVFTSDSRTNAGIDQVSTYSKMHTFGREGDRQFVLLSAGNLATTQGVVARLQRDIREGWENNLFSMGDMHVAADYIGAVSRDQQTRSTGGGNAFEASFILGGQIGNEPPAILQIYPEGNHITASRDTPYLQIGESKYGKPILDRIINTETSLEQAALCALVSMDSTMRSNVTVGPPIDLLIYHADSLRPGEHVRLNHDSPYLRELKKSWESGLTEAFRKLPPLNMAKAGDHVRELSSATH